MPPLPDRARVELDVLGRELGLVVFEMLRQTDKSLLVAGTVAGRPVVAKVLLEDDPFWKGKLGHEIGVYRIFDQHEPPLRVPRLVYTDARLLVVERVEGQPLDTERYPDRTLPDAQVDSTLGAITALNEWQPPEATFTTIFDYSERTDRYRDHGILTDLDAKALHSLLRSCPQEWEVNHGDPLPSNVLVTPDNEAALLDWEFTGLFLPGFDLALLHTLLASTPHAVKCIEHIVRARDIAIPFTINLAMVLTREIRTHRELPDCLLRDRRLPLIETLWTRARDRMHTLAEGR
jgi:hypothetical protein